METNFTIDRGFGTAAAVVLSIEMILALIANGMVLLITITQRKSWKQSSTIFFTSLILAHLVINILYLPFYIIGLAALERGRRELCTLVLFQRLLTVRQPQRLHA